MSRATYVKHLEHDLTASKKIINDLCSELHELREQLKVVQQSRHEISHQKSTRPSS
jgi:predicted RNase H-like nuclease (RuvC/YqgF family)